jgi:UDP-N-acetylmuramoyl-tripeptide--D-alanyl-D-alanine ligase
MEKISLQEVGVVLAGEVFPDFPIRGFAFDSRLVQPGFVFFALKGEKVDGHNFLEDVALKGAICAIVSRSFVGEVAGLYLIRVDDVKSALQKLAKWKMSLSNLKCIAVTGSVGKTTTKEFIATILEGSFKVRKTPGSFNSQVGLPLSILNLEEGGEVFVVEMGMSNPGEISKLVDIVPPDIAVVTKVALAHSLFFPGGLEEIARAKAEILSSPNTQKAFLNNQVRQFKAFQEKAYCEKVYYGLSSNLDVQKEDHLIEKRGDRFIVEGRLFSLPFTASHMTENFLAAALVARELGLEWEVIFQRAMKLVPYQGRFERLEKKGVLYIDDSYNANPESVKAALQNLPKPQVGKKVIAVLGEMRELGNFSQKAHQEIGRIASKEADLLLCLAGDTSFMAEEFSLSGKPAHFFDNLQTLRKTLNTHVEQGDVVLIKASKSLKMWEVLEEDD